MKHKKIYVDGNYVPQRMCVSCRRLADKKSLIRVAKLNDGTVGVMKSGGRGVYVCNNTECLLKLKKSNGLSRGLKTCVPKEIYEECCAVER